MPVNPTGIVVSHILNSFLGGVAKSMTETAAAERKAQESIDAYMGRVASLQGQPTGVPSGGQPATGTMPAAQPAQTTLNSPEQPATPSGGSLVPPTPDFKPGELPVQGGPSTTRTSSTVPVPTALGGGVDTYKPDVAGPATSAYNTWLRVFQEQGDDPREANRKAAKMAEIEQAKLTGASISFTPEELALDEGARKYMVMTKLPELVAGKGLNPLDARLLLEEQGFYLDGDKDWDDIYAAIHKAQLADVFRDKSLRGNPQRMENVLRSLSAVWGQPLDLSIIPGRKGTVGEFEGDGIAKTYLMSRYPRDAVLTKSMVDEALDYSRMQAELSRKATEAGSKAGGGKPLSATQVDSLGLFAAYAKMIDNLFRYMNQNPNDYIVNGTVDTQRVEAAVKAGYLDFDQLPSSYWDRLRKIRESMGLVRVTDKQLRVSQSRSLLSGLVGVMYAMRGKQLSDRELQQALSWMPPFDTSGYDYFNKLISFKSQMDLLITEKILAAKKAGMSVDEWVRGQEHVYETFKQDRQAKLSSVATQLGGRVAFSRSTGRVVITDFSGKVIYSEVVDPTNLGAYPVTQRELIAAVQERTGASDYLSEKKKLDDMREDQQVADRMLKEMQNAPEK